MNEFRVKNLSYYFLNPVIPDQTPMAPSVHAFLKPAQCGLQINIRKTTCAFLIYTAAFGLLAGCCVCLLRFNLWGSLSPWNSRYLLLFFGKFHSSLCVFDRVTRLPLPVSLPCVAILLWRNQPPQSLRGALSLAVIRNLSVFIARLYIFSLLSVLAEFITSSKEQHFLLCGRTLIEPLLFYVTATELRKPLQTHWIHFYLLCSITVKHETLWCRACSHIKL